MRANAELEETNRGVMALHAELSDELEQTNRGVVALYAELDEASTRAQEASESEDPVLGERQPRAAHAAQLGAGSRRGCCWIAGSDALTRRATPSGRDDPRLGRHAVVAGQRAARRREGRVGPARGASGAVDLRSGPRPAARLAGPAGRRRTSPSSSRSPRTRPVLRHRSRCCWGGSCATWSATRSSSPCGARCGAAHRRTTGTAGRRRVRHGHRHPARSTGRGCSRSSTRCPGPLQSRARGHRPRAALRPPGRRAAGRRARPGQRGRPRHDRDPAAAAGRREGPPRGSGTVLVVDDDPAFRSVVRHASHRRGPGVRGR